jgi:hypothetical protein
MELFESSFQLLVTTDGAGERQNVIPAALFNIYNRRIVGELAEREILFGVLSAN